MDYITIDAAIWPDEIGGLHLITLTGKDGDDAICELRAIRYSEELFTFGDSAENLHWAFDHYSLDAVGLSEEAVRRRAALDKAFPYETACGAVGIIEIRTKPQASGRRLALEMLTYLRDLHSGLPWFAFTLAVPIDLRHDDPEFPALQARLIRYYLSDAALGFRQVGDINSPGLLAAHWYHPPMKAL